MTHPDLPAGWVCEDMAGHPDHMVIRSPEGYMATVDLKLRCFRSGMSISGPGVIVFPAPKYVGRGWRNKLCDDAVKHLESVRSTP